jgi:hypothetical protein
MIFPIIRFRYWIEGGNWPALNNIKCVASQTPFYILRTAEMFFNLSAQQPEL